MNRALSIASVERIVKIWPKSCNNKYEREMDVEVYEYHFITRNWTPMNVNGDTAIGRMVSSAFCVPRLLLGWVLISPTYGTSSITPCQNRLHISIRRVVARVGMGTLPIVYCIIPTKIKRF